MLFWCNNVPNVPCEVESLSSSCLTTGHALFLMVPNVPCGVESGLWYFARFVFTDVPNVPCGVESCLDNIERIEILSIVPNVPCGVER